MGLDEVTLTDFYRSEEDSFVSRWTAAREMAISTNTVSFHLRHIYEKLQVHSKTEAVAKALRQRLV